LDWVDAYLEWMAGDDGMIGGPVCLAADDVDADDAFPAERAQFRETVLLDALEMESECIHILRQILDRGSRTPETLALALETLRSADDLLADESRAWHVLASKRRWPAALSPAATWENQLDYNWSKALDNVAVDVHALTGRVLALQAGYH
jgi:hypothetical protein